VTQIQHRTDWKAGRRDMDRSRLPTVLHTTAEEKRQMRLEEDAEKRAAKWVAGIAWLIGVALAVGAWWAA
jgi:hypothetical protein